jgi:lipopolysaccharide/colanic/teichoic acid biosynthesis glycosyltransferase
MLESSGFAADPVVDRRAPAIHRGQPQAALSLPIFHRALELERARSDRSGLAFSLVAFRPRGEEASAMKEIARFLGGRLREIDTLGYLPDGRLGALLPYTPESGAWHVADEVVAQLSLDQDPPACEVYVYPTNWPKPPEAVEASEEALEMPSRSAQPLEPLFERTTPWWKRPLDVVGAILGLLFLLPLFLAVAAAIRLTSPGPVFFAQWRTGLAGRRFRMWKFRSMVDGSEAQRNDLLALNEQDGPAFKIKRDPRVTPLGRWLRRTSIDELPQLWNVLRGEMSLVGPRPLPCYEAEDCEVWQRRRLDVLPGLTCIWQVRGRSEVSFDEWVRMDEEYIRTQSLWNDMKLIALTLPAMLLRRSGC